MAYKRTITYTVVGDAEVADVIEDAVRIGLGERYNNGITHWRGDRKRYGCATGDKLPATIVAVDVQEGTTEGRPVTGYTDPDTHINHLGNEWKDGDR